MTVVKGVGRGFRINFVSCTSSQQAADVGILGTFTFASIIPSCSFTFASIIPSCSFTFASIIPSCSITFASIIPSCSFTFARVIPTLFSFFLLKLFYFTFTITITTVDCIIFADDIFCELEPNSDFAKIIFGELRACHVEIYG